MQELARKMLFNVAVAVWIIPLAFARQVGTDSSAFAF